MAPPKKTPPAHIAVHGSPTPYLRNVTYAITAVLLLLSLSLHLLPALLAGLLIYELISLTAPLMQRKLSSERAIVASVAAVAFAVITLVAITAFGLIAFLRSDAGSLSNLFAKLAEIVEQARNALPPWIVQSLPDSAEAIHDSTIGWLKEHSREMQTLGKEAAHVLAHTLIGMVIGALAAIGASHRPQHRKVFAAALTERVWRLGNAFRRIVFAQLQISTINCLLTAVFLAVLMPLIGFQLPLVKTLIAVTLIAGLLPVIGNLISNLMIVLVSLSVSMEAALTSLAFLVIVHKLEYFLNARIVGNQISASAWELLLAMLVMEAAFGLPGVVAAPIFYAYLKDELASGDLV